MIQTNLLALLLVIGGYAGLILQATLGGSAKIAGTAMLASSSSTVTAPIVVFDSSAISNGTAIDVTNLANSMHGVTGTALTFRVNQQNSAFILGTSAANSHTFVNPLFFAAPVSANYTEPSPLTGLVMDATRGDTDLFEIAFPTDATTNSSVLCAALLVKVDISPTATWNGVADDFFKTQGVGNAKYVNMQVWGDPTANGNAGQLYFSYECSTGGSAPRTPINQNVWYWLTELYSAAGSSLAQALSLSGTPLDSGVTCNAGSSVAPERTQVGHGGNGVSASSGNVYIAKEILWYYASAANCTLPFFQ